MDKNVLFLVDYVCTYRGVAPQPRQKLASLPLNESLTLSETETGELVQAQKGRSIFSNKMEGFVCVGVSFPLPSEGAQQRLMLTAC
jgi:hypothetical protein